MRPRVVGHPEEVANLPRNPPKRLSVSLYVKGRETTKNTTID
jgi:hypothetical protein